MARGQVQVRPGIEAIQFSRGFGGGGIASF